MIQRHFDVRYDQRSLLKRTRLSNLGLASRYKYGAILVLVGSR